MDSSRKKAFIIGGAVLLVAVIGWFLMGGENPEKDLTSGRQDRRLLAIEKLEQKDSPEAARIILQYTTDNDIQVARRSLYALGRMPNGAKTEVLTQAMSSENPQIREAAVVAMGMRGDKTDKVAMRDRLARDPSPEVRVAAAAELGAMRDWDSVPLLVSALDSQDETLANVAMRCLLDIGGREHAGFKPGATPAQRAEAIRALKRDWQSFKAINTEYDRYRTEMNKK